MSSQVTRDSYRNIAWQFPDPTILLSEKFEFFSLKIKLAFHKMHIPKNRIKKNKYSPYNKTKTNILIYSLYQVNKSQDLRMVC